MVQKKDETSEWLYKTVCADYEQYAILNFKIVELKRNENVLDVSLLTPTENWSLCEGCADSKLTRVFNHLLNY